MKADKQDKQSDHAGVAFHPPLLLLAALAVGFLLRWLVPLPGLTVPGSARIGSVVVALSFGLFFWALTTMLRGHASIPTNRRPMRSSRAARIGSPVIRSTCR